MNFDQPSPQESVDIKTEYKEVFDTLATLPSNEAREMTSMLYDLRPVAQLGIETDASNNEKALEKLESLKKTGLAVSMRDLTSEEEKAKGITYWDIAVSKDPALAQEVIDLEQKRANDPEFHKRFGELMGFPDTAIEAYIQHTCLTDAEKEQLGFPKEEDGYGPMVIPFGISKEHYREEAQYLKKYFKALMDTFPDTYGTDFKGDVLEKYKKDVENFLNKDF